MANKYFSEVRALIAKNFVSGTINPPSDFVINPVASADRFFWLSNSAVNVQTNLLLKRFMINCNFADGLVFKTPCQAFSIRLVPFAFSESSGITGTVTFNGGTNNVTGVGTQFSVELAVGNRIYDGFNYVYEIATITNDTAMTVRECIPLDQTATTGVSQLLAQVGTDASVRPFHVDMLNTWYTADATFYPSVFSTTAGTRIGIELQPRVADAVPGIEFLTSSISTDFADETAFFDCIAEIEYTPI